MTIRNLDHLLAPRTIAVIGASPSPRSVGQVLARNLLRGGFGGPIMPVNPNHRAVEGVLAYPDVAHLPEPPDLAVICTPPKTVPALIDDLGRLGCRAAVVVTAGFGEGGNEAGAQLRQQMLDAAAPHLLRIVGPNCIGIAVPGIGLNATFADRAPLPGDVACLTQSGAVAAALIDWAAARGVGFSHLVSLGDMADVDFGDLLDYFAIDPKVRAVLLYAEGIVHARKFMSAARAASRAKPVIVVKSGRFAASAKAAHSHTGALAGSDTVYDAAFRRAGMLRVGDLEDLFDAFETLSRCPPLGGDRLAILTNGGGVGVLAVDAVAAMGGHLAALDEATCAALDGVLPVTWSRGNPIDIIGDASGERYAAALDILLKARDLDAILILNCPTAIASSVEAARAVIDTLARNARHRRIPVLTSWLGGETAETARGLFAAAGVPTYTTPEQAVRAMLQMVEFRRNQALLAEVPPRLRGAEAIDASARQDARRVIEAAREAGRTALDEIDAKRVLAAYGIPVPTIKRATSPAEVAQAAAAINAPVAVKIVSPDIIHKSDAGGVALDCLTPEAAWLAADSMLKTIRAKLPEARVEGFAVSEMVRRRDAFELILGASVDPVFGPVLLFGHGGTGVEVIQDTATALPPLNAVLARDLMGRTRIDRLLRGYRSFPAADRDAIAGALVNLSELISDHPEITELDINPLLADAGGVLALDARIKLGFEAERAPFAILPYPSECEREITLRDGTALVARPVKPEDAVLFRDMFKRIDPVDIRMRFLAAMRSLPEPLLARLTQIDYDREMAWMALAREAGGEEEMLGIVRLSQDPDRRRAEYAVLVRSDMKGRGLGYALMRVMLDYADECGVEEVFGVILRENRAMIDLARELGFAIRPDPEDPSLVEAKILVGDARPETVSATAS